MAQSCVGEGFSEELTCALCLDSWKDPAEMVPCGHIFCKECAAAVRSCPVCRRSIDSQQTPNRTLVNMALSVRCRCRECGWTGTREESQRHRCSGPSGNPASTPPASEAFGLKPPSSFNPQLSCSPSPYGRPSYPPSSTNAPWTQQAPQGFTQGPPPPSVGYYGQPQQSQQQGSAPGGRRRRYETIVPSGSHPWMLYGIDQQEYDQIVSLFVFFDDDDSGELDRKEVTRLARWLNFARTPQEIERIFADMDSDGSGALSLGEFLTWLKYNRPNPQALYGMTQSQYSTIMMQFHSYDRNQDGLLEESEFCRLVLGLGDVRDLPSAQRLFRQIDTNGDGSIDLHEFLRFRAGRR